MNQLRQDVRELGDDVKELTFDVARPVHRLLKWSVWELVAHIAFAVLFVYVAYMFYANVDERNTSNWLLLLIALGVAVQIYQNINLRNALPA